MVLNKQPSPASGYIIVSCCVNDAQNAWVVYSNGDIFCINDVINVNDNWYKIPSDKISGKLTQISCDTRYNIYLTGVNDKGELYYANTNITTSPNWSKVPTAPKASYVSMNSDGTCQLITQDGRLLFSNGQIDKNPPFNIQNSTNGNKPKIVSTLCISYNDYSAYYAENAKGVNGSDGNERSGNILFVASNVYSNTTPDWKGRIMGPRMNDMAFNNVGRIVYTSSGNIGYKTMWDDDSTKGSISKQGKTFKCVALTTGDLFIATTDKNGGEVAFGYINAISGYNNNGLINPEYYGKKYYGNSIPVTKAPYKITLTGQIPIKNWRQGIEYHYNLCGCSSRCGSYNRKEFPYNESGFPIESPRGDTDYSEFYGNGNCAAIGCGFYLTPWDPQNEAWCLVKKDYLTHIFGYGTQSNLFIPTTNDQYGNRDPSALDLQITPFDKKIKSSDEETTGLTPDYADTSYFSNDKNRPIFKSISFNLPNPSEEIDIDSVIPYILIQYAATDYGKNLPGITSPGPVIDMYTVNDYLSKYFFTNVGGNPRISFITSKKNMYKYLQPILTIWKNSSVNSYQVSAQKYCKDNLTTAWCMDVCKTADPTTSINCDINLQAFCKSGGNGKLPDFTNNGLLPTVPVTKKILDAAYPNYSKYPDVCGCNMPTRYYQQLDVQAFQQIPDSVASNEIKQLIYKNISLAGGVGGRPACDPVTNCRSGGNVLPNKANNAQGVCPTIAIQTCLQQATVSTGDVTGSTNTGTISQAMSCKQEISSLVSSALDLNNPLGVNNSQAKGPINAGPVTITYTQPGLTTTVTNTGGGGLGGGTNTVKTTPYSSSSKASSSKASSSNASPSNASPPKSSKTLLIIIVIVIVLLILFFLMMKMMKKKK